MTIPPRVRIDWRRSGGRKPPDVIVCSRPGPFGNPWKVEEFKRGNQQWFRVLDDNGKVVKGSATTDRDRTIADCLKLYRWYLEEMLKLDPAFLDPLRTAAGLACYCRETESCHVDVIREILAATSPSASSAT